MKKMGGKQAYINAKKNVFYSIKNTICVKIHNRLRLMLQCGNGCGGSAKTSKTTNEV